MIKLDNISKSFGKQEVLKRLFFTFENAKTYGIVGKNGTGKTTLLKCIAGLESYEGERIYSEHTPLKNHLGFLPTEPFFYSMMTGLEYLQYMNNARQGRISDFMSRNIFDLPLKQYISTYSSGMKKKLALFAVLLMDVEYFILDEPFNGIDFQSSMLIFDILKALKAKGKTIIISSHIYATLTQSCDEIGLLEDGCFKRHVFKDRFSELEEQIYRESIQNKISELGI